MPWFYAGPEAKPVGPVSVEQLHANRVNGTISPDTYVIEQTGQPGATMTWRRYREAFPDSPPQPNLPPIPALPPTPLPVPPVPAAPPAHPLFPSAAVVPGAYVAHPVAPQSAPHPAPIKRPTNSFCAWGFWLGLTSFIFSMACGLGILLAPIAILLCIIGLVQVFAHREQGGQYQAIWGLILSFIALLIAVVLIGWVDMPFFKDHGMTVTEQTSNDTE